MPDWLCCSRSQAPHCSETYSVSESVRATRRRQVASEALDSLREWDLLYVSSTTEPDPPKGQPTQEQTMSYSNAGRQAIPSTKHQPGQVREEPSYETYVDLAASAWHGGRKDRRRERMEVNRRKLMASLAR